jgi:hypothetical protein
MTIAPIVRTVEVKATPLRAFELFATQMSSWWPKGKTIGKAPHAAIVLEPRADGQWFERDADGTEITFDLRATGDETVLSFAHRGFKHADDGYALVNTGWAYYLVSLRQYVETGEGWPHPDVDFACMGH